VSPYFSVPTEVYSSYGIAGTSNTWQISSYQIPFYDHTFTVADVEVLNSRPFTDVDFANGFSTSAEVGVVYPFGSDIGYSQTVCSLGYWPPAFVDLCPIPTDVTVSFPLTPAKEISSGLSFHF
jgi:hypothetical protein